MGQFGDRHRAGLWVEPGRVSGKGRGLVGELPGDGENFFAAVLAKRLGGEFNPPHESAKG